MHLGYVLLFSALCLELPEPGVKLQEQDRSGAERGLPALQVREIILEIPVVAAMIKGVSIKRFAEEKHRQSRRDVQALLGAGDAYVYAEGVHVKRLCEEAADYVNHHAHPMPVTDLRELRQVEKLS